MKRREYPVSITVNDQKISKVIVDPHYEKKHSHSIDDGIILKLVQTLDCEQHEAVAVDEGYSYFVKDRILVEGKSYKLIWLLEKHEIYVGVINAYRRSE